MATRTTVAATPALELAGQYAGNLRSLQMPGYRIDPVVAPIGPGGAARVAANVSISPLDAELVLVDQPGAPIDWLFSLPRGKPVATDGAALLLDANLSVSRRVEWTAALVTELRLPVLDAALGKQPFAIGFSWLPTTVSYAKTVGQKVKPPTGKAKALLCSNFRVTGLPFDGSFVTRVVLPTVGARLAEPAGSLGRLGTRELAQVDLGELRLEFAERSREDVLAWVQKLVNDGQIADSEYLSLNIELLDAALKRVLATLQLSGNALIGYEETRLTAGQETLPRVALRFAVGRMDLAHTP